MPVQDVLVIGLGYVGLPLAVQAARAGFRVTGYDTRPEITAGLMACIRSLASRSPRSASCSSTAW